MIKYIVKRLALSILILFGVSIIIYSLVRCMPVDYLDGKFSSQVANGTVSKADVVRMKKLYGLYVPEGTITISSEDSNLLKDIKLVSAYSSQSDESILDYSGDYIGQKYTLTIKNKSTNELLSGEYVINYSNIEDIKNEVNDENNIKDFYLQKGTWKYNKDTKNLDFTNESHSSLNFTASAMNKKTSFISKTGYIIGGYFNWLGKALSGDLGISFKYDQPVGSLIVNNMGISFGIAFVALIFQFLIAIPLGIKAAVNQYKPIDYVTTIFTMIGISLPTFFMGALVIKLFAVKLGWFETGGLNSGNLFDPTFFQRLIDTAWHLVLPMTVMVVLSIGGLMRYTRTNMLEVLNADYIRTARAKGLSEKDVIYKHAFRNTLIPIVTMLAGILPGLFGGAMITEKVFNIPGIGNMAYQALAEGDIPFIMGYNMFIAMLTVIGTLLSDLMYAVVDPRVKLNK